MCIFRAKKKEARTKRVASIQLGEKDKDGNEGLNDVHACGDNPREVNRLKGQFARYTPSGLAKVVVLGPDIRGKQGTRVVRTQHRLSFCRFKP